MTGRQDGVVPGRQDGPVAGRDPLQDPAQPPLAPGAGEPGREPRSDIREQPPVPAGGTPATDPFAAPVPEGTGHHRDTGRPGHGDGVPHGDSGLPGDTGRTTDSGLHGGTGVQGDPGLHSGAGVQGDPGLRTDDGTGLHRGSGHQADTGLHGDKGLHGDGVHAGAGTGREVHGPNSALVAPDTRDDLAGRLKHAVAGFVDQPRAAVEEADHVLEDLTTRLTETLAGRRKTLRTSWQENEEDTERLRLALRDYRETAERLLSL
ncbi:hypothetical protein [Streptomyces sp. NPDC049813]|uniref:hypothetical protein n=1 Tax=Streptomyces sp. NPDC049813 TaxID=3365597 RepID=UPI00379BD114